MAKNEIPEFALPASDAGMQPPAMSASHEDRILGLRTKLEFFYADAKRCQQQQAADRNSTEKEKKQWLLSLIRVADSFEDVFRMCEQSKRMRKQKETRKAFEETYKLFLETLAESGVHRVEIVGKNYNNVEFEGVGIPEPWSVVSANDQGKRVVRTVVRSLWVRVVDGQLHVLRRAQVTY